MPYFSSFVSGLFSEAVPADSRRSYLRRRVFGHYLTALYRINLDLFRSFKIPSLRDTQVRIENLTSPCDAVPSDVWLDALSLLNLGEGGLKDVAAYRAAERMVRTGTFQPFWSPREDDLRPMSVFHSALFNGDDPKDTLLSKRVIGHYLNALYEIDLDIFRTYKMPPLYSAGIRYETLAPPCEEMPGDVWLDALTLLKGKRGDCKDLSCYLAAQRTLYEGRPCRPATMQPKFLGGEEFSLYHIVVLYNDGTTEDPSPILGMRTS